MSRDSEIFQIRTLMMAIWKWHAMAGLEIKQWDLWHVADDDITRPSDWSIIPSAGFWLAYISVQPSLMWLWAIAPLFYARVIQLRWSQVTWIPNSFWSSEQDERFRCKCYPTGDNCKQRCSHLIVAVSVCLEPRRRFQYFSYKVEWFTNIQIVQNIDFL